MAKKIALTNWGRLEDFIELAQKGKHVELEVELDKRYLNQQIHADETNDWEPIDTYLLIAEYTLTVDNQSHKISKVYMYAATEKSSLTAQGNKNIANTRLEVDYQRLKTAGITFDEKFF